MTRAPLPLELIHARRQIVVDVQSQQITNCNFSGAHLRVYFGISFRHFVVDISNGSLTLQPTLPKGWSLLNISGLSISPSPSELVTNSLLVARPTSGAFSSGLSRTSHQRSSSSPWLSGNKDHSVSNVLVPWCQYLRFRSRSVIHVLRLSFFTFLDDFNA